MEGVEQDPEMDPGSGEGKEGVNPSSDSSNDKLVVAPAMSVGAKRKARPSKRLAKASNKFVHCMRLYGNRGF